MLRTLGNRAAALLRAAACGTALAVGTAAPAAAATESPADGDSNGGAALGAILIGFAVVVLIGVVLVKIFGRKPTDDAAKPEPGPDD
jgi:hypothetical protein